MKNSVELYNARVRDRSGALFFDFLSKKKRERIARPLWSRPNKVEIKIKYSYSFLDRRQIIKLRI